MIVKVLGVLDIAAALVMVGLGFWDLKIAGLVLAAMLGLKALVFISEKFASLLDLGAVVFLVLAAFGYHNVITYLFALWLLQKGIRSLF